MSARIVRVLSGSLVGLGLLLVSSPALAAGGGGHGFPWVHFAGSVFNFLVFLGILYFAGFKKMQEFFATRKETLEANLNEAKRLREEAEAQLGEYQKRLDSLEAERERLLEEYNEQGERERDRLVADAKRQVEKMRADAELMLKQEVKRAMAALEERVVDEALSIASEKAREEAQGAEDDLFDAYVRELDSLDSLHGAA